MFVQQEVNGPLACIFQRYSVLRSVCNYDYFLMLVISHDLMGRLIKEVY